MEKIAISEERLEGEQGEKRLKPIIEYCLKRGSTLSSASIERPFRSTPNGGLCVINGAIDLKTIQEVFSLPDDILFNTPFDNCLWDKTHNNAICFEDWCVTSFR